MSGPTTRAKYRLGAFLLVAPWAVAACSGPIDSVVELEGLYGSVGEGGATYSTEVPNRDAVEFGIEHLALLWSSDAGDLDDFGWARATAVTTEIGREDPSKIMRARGYETTAALWRIHHNGPYRFDSRPVDVAELVKTFEPLAAMAAAPEEEREVLALAKSAEIASAATELGATHPDSYAVARWLLLLAAHCGEAIEETDATPAAKGAVHAAARALVGQVAFLSALPDLERGRGAADDASEPRMDAGGLLVTVDPAAATIELGKVWSRLRDPLVKIALLKRLGDSGLAAEGVHPSLRGPLLHDLDPDEENAALRYWSRRTLNRLLRLDPDKATEGELRAKWLALGDWDVAARRS
jgi:hypothetical protein